MEDYSSKTFKVYTFSEKELLDEFKIKKEKKMKVNAEIQICKDAENKWS